MSHKHLQKMVWFIVLFLAFPLFSGIPAFPTAEGFGRFSQGGRNGTVIKVTNLNDSGPGSFRDALSQNQKRIIVFEVSGLIELQSKLRVHYPYCTIAGQTAPGDGITLKNFPLIIDASHVIVRYIRSRLGTRAGQSDAISISRGSHIILDHCSASWSVDEVLSNQSDDVDSMTVQWCMITESLNQSVHPKGDHGYGGIIGGLNQSYHHNLIAHHKSRTPKVSWRRPMLVDFRNNVIYNWKSNNCYDGADAHMNWVANYYKYGPATEKDVKNQIFELFDDKNPDCYIVSKLFCERNFVWGFPDITDDNWAGGIHFDANANEEKNRTFEAFDCPPVTEQSAEIAFKCVLDEAGASLTRDLIDTRIVSEVHTGEWTFGKKGIIDSPQDVGGWPVHYTFDSPLDTDQDGLPDYWEDQYHLNNRDPGDYDFDPDGDGYGHIEEYLNNSNPLNDGKTIVNVQAFARATVEHPGCIVFKRFGDTDKVLSVDFAIRGSAVSGVDFQPLPGSAVFQPGENTVEWLVNKTSQKNDRDKFLHVELLSKPDSYYVGCPATNFVAIQAEIISRVANAKETVPRISDLINYPNPFNSATTISFILDKAGWVQLSIYNVNGQLIETIFKDVLQAGPHTQRWQASGVPSGVYISKLETVQQTVFRKMLLVR